MSAEREWTPEGVEAALRRVRSRKVRAEKTLRAAHDDQNELFHLGRKVGVSIAAMARASGSHEQHVRNVLTGQNTAAAKRQAADRTAAKEAS